METAAKAKLMYMSTHSQSTSTSNSNEKGGDLARRCPHHILCLYQSSHTMQDISNPSTLRLPAPTQHYTQQSIADLEVQA